MQFYHACLTAYPADAAGHAELIALTWKHKAEDAGRQQVGVGAVPVLVVVIHPDGVLLPPAAGVRRRLEPLPDAPAEARRPDHKIEIESNTQSERRWQALRKLTLIYTMSTRCTWCCTAAALGRVCQSAFKDEQLSNSSSSASTARPVVAGLAAEEGERVAPPGRAALQRAGRKLLRVVDRRQQQVLQA
jgi:hypothetical protein